MLWYTNCYVDFVFRFLQYLEIKMKKVLLMFIALMFIGCGTVSEDKVDVDIIDFDVDTFDAPVITVDVQRYNMSEIIIVSKTKKS